VNSSPVLAVWEGQPLGRAGAERARKLLIDQTPIEKALKGGSLQQRPILQLVATVLTLIEGPIELEALVNIIAALLQVREREAVSLDDQELHQSKELKTHEVRADNQIEMRELLGRLWEVIDELPAEQRKCYFYSYKDSSDEDLLTLLVALGVVEPRTIAARLEISLAELSSLKKDLPLKTPQIAPLLGETSVRVGKLIFWRGRKSANDYFPRSQKIKFALGKIASDSRVYRVGKESGRRRRWDISLKLRLRHSTKAPGVKRNSARRSSTSPRVRPCREFYRELLMGRRGSLSFTLDPAAVFYDQHLDYETKVACLEERLTEEERR
jgi:hypothetical protein